MSARFFASVHLESIKRDINVEAHTLTPGDGNPNRRPYPALTIEGVTIFGDLDDLREIYSILGAYLSSPEAARAAGYRRTRDEG